MTNLNSSVFLITKMDCPSEEQIIRMKLDAITGIHALDFDIPNRKLTVSHHGNVEPITQSLASLNFNSSLLSTNEIENSELDTNSFRNESSLLWTVLLINFVFFAIELSTGLLSRSMGLVADSLDMLADAIVYGLSLLAVGATIVRKKLVAKWSGYFQIGLATIGIIEVLRRFFGYEATPDFKTMIIISILALIANGICLYLLLKSKSQEAHMKASLIFTSNDVIINVGVIIAGILVYVLNSKYPDLIIGSIVFIIVTRGALSILKLAR